MYKDVKQERNRTTQAKNLLFSAGINLVIMLVIFSISDVVYETNDDFAISRMLSAGYPYVGFVNYFLCKLLIFAQNLISKYNAFVISQIVLSFISFSSILAVFFNRERSISGRALAVMTCAFFSLDHYSGIQFTKTAALLMTAGLLLVTDNYIHDRTTRSFVFGFALFYIGVALRQKGMFPAMAYVVAFLAIYYLILATDKDHKDALKGKGFKKEAIIAVIMIVVAIAPYGIDKLSDKINESTDELKLAREYQAERRQITDYPLMKYYDEKEDEFSAIGISENDLFVLSRWILDYDGVASLENLEKINAIIKPIANDKTLIQAIKKAVKESLYAIKDKSFTGLHILIVILIALYVITTNKPRSWLYIIAIGFVTVLIYVTIYYMQRPQYRALYIADVSAAFWLLYASAIGAKSNSGKLSILMAAVSLALILYMFKPAIHSLDVLKEHNSNQVIGAEIIDYFENNQDKFFVGPTTSMGMSPGYETPLLKAVAVKNMADTGGWDTLSPYRLEMLKNGGITNPVKDLLNSDNVVFFGNGKIKTLKKYYEKWYCREGEEVVFEKIDEVCENGIYRVYTRGAGVD